MALPARRARGVNRTPDDADEFGPAMRKLTISEQMFVCALFGGAKSATKAARIAGYEAATNGALRIRAHRLQRNPLVVEAIREESKRRTVFLLPKAQRALHNLLDKPLHPGHVAAIKMVRDDGGVTAAVQRVLNVNVTITQEEKIETLRKFAAAHGGTILGMPLAEAIGETTDAEFEEIEPNCPEVRESHKVTVEDLI